MPIVASTARLREFLAARTVDEVLWDNEDRARFVVEGLLHATTTLVYGLSEAGKTWLMVDMIKALVAGTCWLGQPVHGGARRCLVLAADAGGEWEYAERLGNGFEDTVLLARPPAVDVDRWQTLAQNTAAAGFGVVLVDNLYAWAGAVDMNSNAEVARPLACLGAVARAGVAVVLVHHTNSGGKKPAGVHSIPAFFRHSMKVTRTTLRSHGNDAADVEYRLRRDGGRIVHASPLGLADAATVADTTSPTAKTDGRTRKAAVRYQEALTHLQKAPPGLSQRALGQYLADRMGSVQNEDSGRNLVRTMATKGLWVPPRDASSTSAGG
ncbi:AAA family ATPase [Geodermatophilus sp. SYSU D00691]